MQYSLSELQMYLNQLYNGARLLLTPWAYPLTFVLAGNATLTQMLAIQANGDFLITGVDHRAVVGGAAQTVSNKTAPQVRMLVTDSGSNEQFTQAAVDLECYSRNDGKMRVMPWPRLVQGRSSLSVQVTSYSAEAYSSLDIVFSGIQIRVVG